MFMIPRGFAHGFLVLSDEAEFAYKCDDIYNSIYDIYNRDGARSVTI